MFPPYSIIATIRFDVRKEDDIQYHKNWTEITASLKSHLPDPSLGFGDSNTGSDVLKMIEKFLDNRQAPICGSRMFILVKRYPNETEIDGLVGKLRKHHASLTVMYSMTPSGGHHSETLNNLAIRTNGFSAFDYDSDYHYTVGILASMYMPYLLYAANPQISGQGNISLATLRVPVIDRPYFAMTLQDQMPMDVDETVMLTWSRFGSPNSTSLGVSGRNSSKDYSGNHLGGWYNCYKDYYSMSLNYKYSDSKLKTLQIRVSTDKPVNYWVPYDD